METLSLSFIDMPEHFTHLLRVDMSSSSRWHTGLQHYIFSNPSLMGIVNRILSDGKEVDINSQINTLGWHGIRDKIISYYINFLETKEHAVNVNIDNIKELKKFELSLRNCTVSGYSRLLLFAFYLKIDSFENDIDSIENHPLYPNQTVMKLLKLSKERVVKIDHLIILVTHLLDFFGEEMLTEFINQDFSYESIYLKLTEEQKENLCSNFLNYCGSVGESDIFSSRRI